MGGFGFGGLGCGRDLMIVLEAVALAVAALTGAVAVDAEMIRGLLS